MAIFEITHVPLSLGKSIRLVVLLPDGVDPAKCPLLYLLHGLSDDSSSWLHRTRIETYAAEHGLAVVMPDGGKSWYCNQSGALNYYDYIAKEIPEFLMRTFRLGGDPSKRFIAGLSMGGYGAMKFALREPGSFAAAAGFSGSTDPVRVATRHPAIYEAAFKTTPWAPEDDLDHLVENYPVDVPKPRLYVSCGTKDERMYCSEHLRDHARKNGFEVVWDDEPLNHCWEFWDHQIRKAIPWMLEGR